MDNRMLVLWATPRSTSTALESMMDQRGDFRCLREPFGVPYYRGVDRRTTRFDASAQDPTITYEATWQNIQREHRKGRVFTKDFPNYIMHMADADFLDCFQHTFLVQDPAKTLPSMYQQWSTFTMDECSYEALARMFHLVTERFEETPVVIDSADLVDDPYRTVEAYCKAVGIPFVPESVEWSEREASAFSSNGDVPQSNPPGTAQPSNDELTIDQVPFLKDMYERCLPHYETLIAHKL